MSEANELRMQGSGSSDGHDEQKGKYMTFQSGNEYFGLEIQYVNEIIKFQSVTAIPETEDYIKGLINLRGKVIPVIDVRLRFKQPPLEYNDRTCIIVINVKSMMEDLWAFNEEKVARALFLAVLLLILGVWAGMWWD